MMLFLDYLEESPIRVVAATMEDYTAARRLAEEAGPGFHSMWDDLVMAAQMRRLGIEEVYSSDRGFDKIPWVRRIFNH